MRTKIVKALIRKELLDVLRDKKAVIMMLVVPLIIYPLIFFGTLAVMSAVQSGMESTEYKVVIGLEGHAASDEAITSLTDAIERHNAISSGDASDEQTVDYLKTEVRDIDYDTAAKELQDESIDVYIRHWTLDKDDRDNYQIVYVSSITNSEYAADVVSSIIKDMNYDKSVDLIEAEGLSSDKILKPIVSQLSDIASTEQTTGNLLGMVLPFLLIISLLMGTMYPAIDTTAGEKERGTLETLLTLPVTNREIIVSKFITVAAIGIVSALMNILSMGMMAVYMIHLIGSGFTEGINVSFSSFLPVILVTVLAILVFSLFISAVTMCITAFAKSYKEANNYITPLTLVVMLTGYIGFIPNIELNRTMALIPVANIVLLIKNILQFKFDAGIVAIVLASNVVYAILAILFLSRVYDSEGILFDEGRSGIQLFERRSNMKRGGVPTTGDAWFLICVVFIAVIYLGSLLQLRFGFGGVFGTQLIILLIPLAFVLYTKRDIRKTYSIKKTGIASFIGGIFLILGALLLGILLTALTSFLFPSDASAAGGGMTDLLSGNGFLITLLVAALMPAICEEMMFRGFIMSAFRTRYRIVTVIILVSLLFGLYHMSIVRFFTTALLGAALGIQLYYSGSIFPSMLMHFLNNSIAVVQLYYPELLTKILPFMEDEAPDAKAVIFILFAGLLLSAAGIEILRLSSGRLHISGDKTNE